MMGDHLLWPYDKTTLTQQLLETIKKITILTAMRKRENMRKHSNI